MSFDVCIRAARYGRRTVLENIEFCVPDGSLVAVIGRNGCGKSTLISCLASLIPFEGQVALNGTDVRQMDVRTRAQKLSVLLQETGRPHVTVRELVSFGRNPYRAVLGRESDADRAAVARAVEVADLGALADAYVDRISGGEARRAYFGALLAQDTPVLLLDEATAFMDRDRERKLLSTVRTLADGGRTVLSVMHDLSSALAVADRILLLDGGKQVFFGTTEALLDTDLVERTLAVRRYAADGTIFFA
ncbi:MAG: ABC transporter ATP-binding protein [Clostridia bacterium]|nr:ABC transporter ATP-binding protein [Clostridia bacterium]